MQGNFTYENQNFDTVLEKYEWDNVWWESTNNVTAKRVLYIGDSISCAIRTQATATSGDSILFDGFGTSKALDNPYFKQSVEMFAAQQNHLDAILFNNGLHGWHLSEERYEELYGEFVLFLKEMAGKRPLFIVLTTDDAYNPTRQLRVEERNRAAVRVAKKYDLPVIDLATKAKECACHHIPDGVHFDEEGYRIMAEFIVSQIKDKVL